jgi:hydrogenase maturation protease
MMPAPVLIFAIGNESRGDDALGPLLLRELENGLNSTEGRREKSCVEPFELLEDFQLQIEHAMDLSNRKRVLFIDAGMDTPAPFSFYRVQASDEAVLYSHALSPEALLKTYAQFYGETAPEAFVLCIRGISFELGEALSPVATEHLAQALQFVRQQLLEAGSADWNTIPEPAHARSISAQA